MSDEIVIGIDTSNYTTSVAIMTLDGELLANIKRPLPVREGERGLRQSEAVFAHIKNLPSCMDEAEGIIAGKTVRAVGVSSGPRRVEGSYMPCFLSGVAAAKSISSALGVPLYEFSHQCGHIMAAIYSAKKFELLEREFAAFHVSGGTTELLRVAPAVDGFSAEHVGGTKDLNAGQVIDRIGVKLGLRFPCGPKLEELALCNDLKIPKQKVSRSGLFINLSGAENIADKVYASSGSKELCAAFVFDHISNALSELTDAYFEEYGKAHVIYAGGVMCNSIIKEKLSERYDCSFAEPQMSCDNAVGIAYLALRAHKNNA